MKIRLAQVDDINDIYNLNKECLPIYYSHLEHLLFLMSNTNLVLMATKDNQAIGYLIGEYRLESKNFHIFSIGTSEKYRSQGVGKLLINYLVENSNHKYNNITLNVHDLNERGIRFYLKNKFNIVEHLKNYYGNQLQSPSQSAYEMKRIIENTENRKAQ